MDDGGNTRLREEIPHGHQKWISRIKRTHLQVDLEYSRSRINRRRNVVGNAGLREEGCRLQTAWRRARKRGTPVVEPRGHSRLVCVGQRRERDDPKILELFNSQLVRPAVLDGPRQTVGLFCVVKELPHLRHDRMRHEVGVHINDPGNPEPVNDRQAQSVKPFARRPIARSDSRFASRSAIACRLSYALRPRASAISTLA